MDECAHCKRDILRSSLVKPVEDGDESIELVCTVCNEKYEVPNSEEQKTVMKLETGKPFAKEFFYSIAQLGVGDLVKLQPTDREDSSVYVVVVEVNSEESTAKVSPTLDSVSTKTSNDDGEWMALDALKNKNALIYRFMPLDCLSRQEALDRVRTKFAESVQAKKEMRHFGVWCKIDKFESLELEQISLFQICKTIVTNPLRSYREWRDFGAGINPNKSNL